MAHNPKFELYAKAKIEEPNLQLPKALQKFYTDPSSAEEMAEGAKQDRKVYRIRKVELYKAMGDQFKDMQQILEASKATIGLLFDSESDHHTHTFLDIVGTVEQVKMAEELILDKILETYGPVFPVILMPPNVYVHKIKLHVTKVARLLEENGDHVLAAELVSGAWLQIDDELPPAGGSKDERLVYIYGPKANVFKALSMIHAQIGGCPKAKKELDKLYADLSIVEVIEGIMKSRIPRMDDDVEAAIASGSHQTEEQKFEDAEEANEKDESKGKKEEEEAEHKDEAKDKKLEEDMVAAMTLLRTVFEK